MRKVTKINAINDYAPSTAKLKTAVYCRVSTSSEDQLASLEAQKQHYESYVKANSDWEFVGMYCDEGISGTKKENRNELLHLLMDCEHRKIDFVITKSISRFARNTTDCLEIVRRLSEIGVAILFEKENIHTRNMESELILGILSSLAENESTSISENSKWSIKKRFQNGTFKLSQPPYGYDSEDGMLIPNIEQAEIVKRIFAETLAGKGTRAIALGLNADGIKPLRGINWSATTIRGVISNEKYVGDVIFQKTYTDDKFKRHYNSGEKEQYYIRDHHEAIVSRDDFELASRIVEQRGKEKGVDKGIGKYSKRYIFSGIIICGECGSTFKRRIHQANKYGQYIAWCCNKHISSNSKDCSMIYIREDNIKLAFATMMTKLSVGRTVVMKPFIEDLRMIDEDGVFAKLNEIESLIQENSEQVKVLTSLMTGGYLEPALFNENYNILMTEFSKLKEQRSALENDVDGKKSLISEAQELNQYLTKNSCIIKEFDEALFQKFVLGITVFSPTDIGFRLKCGLTLRERMAR